MEAGQSSVTSWIPNRKMLASWQSFENTHQTHLRQWTGGALVEAKRPQSKAWQLGPCPISWL